jgi:hypothetical protein
VIDIGILSSLFSLTFFGNRLLTAHNFSVFQTFFDKHLLVEVIPMKKLTVYGVILYCIFNTPLFSQNKALFHYPLNNGDLWEYWEAPRFFVRMQHKVTGDTLLSNGKVYKIIEITENLSNAVALQFQRIEDHCVFQARPSFIPPDSVAYDEFLLYKLEVKIDDTWPYPGYGYNGFVADSGFVRVNAFGTLSFGGRNWKGVALGSYTLPDTGLWFDPDVVLVDSLGVYSDAFEGGYYQLRGAIINGRQFGTITSVHEKVTHPPSLVDLRTYPNPVVLDVHIQFLLKRAENIQISIFDLLGRKINEFPLRTYSAGLHTLHWNRTNGHGQAPLHSGLYFVVLTNNANLRLTRKFTVLK